MQCFVFWWEDVCCLHVAQVSYITKFLAEATHCSSLQLCSWKTHLCKEGSAAIGLLYEETGETVGTGYRRADDGGIQSKNPKTETVGH